MKTSVTSVASCKEVARDEGRRVEVSGFVIYELSLLKPETGTPSYEEPTG